MLPDSLQFETPSKEFADSLFKAVNVVSDHTNEFAGWSLVVTIITLLASLATIIGIAALIIAWRKRIVNRRCQKRIIMDMIRHMFTNNTISEVIRLKHPKTGKAVLKEGVMERYCFLDSDIELANMNFTAKSYERLHSLRLRLKNYNSVVLVAEKHFTDPNCPIDIRMEDLDDIWERSARLTNGFLEYANKVGLHITKNDISTFIRVYHNEQDRIPAWKAANQLDEDVDLPNRDNTARAYYDKEPYNLQDIVDTCIRYRSGFVYFRRIKK